MTAKSNGNDADVKIEELTFEQAMQRLREIVEKVESGRIELEESIRQYEQGCKLIQHCRAKLTDAEQRIDVLSKGLDGTLRSDPAEPGEFDVDAEP